MYRKKTKWESKMDRFELEAIVRGMHEAHYVSNPPNGLWHPEEAPNTNTIYKIWSDGEFTYEKGGFAFGERSMKQSALPLVYFSKKDMLPTFPVVCGDNSYAMLTPDECSHVRGLLKVFFEPMLPKCIEVRIDSDDTERINIAIRRVALEGIKVTYRSPLPRPTVFVVESLMASSSDVVSRIETCLTESGLLAETFSMAKVEC